MYKLQTWEWNKDVMRCEEKKRIEFSILKWHASLLEMPGL